MYENVWPKTKGAGTVAYDRQTDAAEDRRLQSYLIAVLRAHGGNCTEARRAAEQSHDVHAGLAAWDVALESFKAAGGCVGGGCGD